MTAVTQQKTENSKQKIMKKTDESVKAGLELEADTKPQNNSTAGNDIPEAENEKDGDEEVHQQKDTVPDTTTSEQDADELVHLKNIDTATNADDEERDVDDMVHGG
jgi:hypothetical protein